MPGVVVNSTNPYQPGYQAIRPFVEFQGGRDFMSGVQQRFDQNKQNSLDSANQAIQDRINYNNMQKQKAQQAALQAQQDAYNRTRDALNSYATGGINGTTPVGTDNGQGVRYTPGETAQGSIALWGDPRSPGWQAHNLVTFRQGKISVTVNRQAATAFRGFLNALTRGGYHLSSVQGYNLRNKRMGQGLSEHAFGTAIDINPNQNPNLGSPVLKTNMPSWVGALAARYGLIWGGTWTKAKDPMHFEYVAPSMRSRL